jgi:3-hydroxybutyryl-CoA dehydrogenase
MTNFSMGSKVAYFPPRRLVKHLKVPPEMSFFAGQGPRSRQIMRIALLADVSEKIDWPVRLWKGSHELLWADSPGSLAALGADISFDLSFVPEPSRIEILSRLLPRPVFVNSVIHTIAAIGQPFIRINAWPGFLNGPSVEISLGPSGSAADLDSLFRALDWKYLVVPDIPGMIGPRVVALIINEAYYTFQAGTSTREEIDLAMKLGTGYPYGPFEWARLIGITRLYALLLALREQDSRYSIAETLEEEAAGS